MDRGQPRCWCSVHPFICHPPVTQFRALSGTEDSSPLGPCLWAEPGSGPVVGGLAGAVGAAADPAALLEGPGH